MMSSQSRFLHSYQYLGDKTGSLMRILLGKGAVEQPSNYGQVAALIICREDNAVFVFGSGSHGDEKATKERKK